MAELQLSQPDFSLNKGYPEAAGVLQGMQAASQMNQQSAQTGLLQQQTKSSEQANAIQRLQTTQQLAGSVMFADPSQQPQVYASALKAAQAQGIDTSGLPPQWGPEAQSAVQGAYYSSGQAMEMMKMKMQSAMMGSEYQRNMTTAAKNNYDIGNGAGGQGQQNSGVPNNPNQVGGNQPSAGGYYNSPVPPVAGQQPQQAAPNVQMPGGGVLQQPSQGQSAPQQQATSSEATLQPPASQPNPQQPKGTLAPTMPPSPGLNPNDIIAANNNPNVPQTPAGMAGATDEAKTWADTLSKSQTGAQNYDTTKAIIDQSKQAVHEGLPTGPLVGYAKAITPSGQILSKDVAQIQQNQVKALAAAGVGRIMQGEIKMIGAGSPSVDKYGQVNDKILDNLTAGNEITNKMLPRVLADLNQRGIRSTSVSGPIIADTIKGANIYDPKTGSVNLANLDNWQHSYVSVLERRGLVPQGTADKLAPPAPSAFTDTQGRQITPAMLNDAAQKSGMQVPDLIKKYNLSPISDAGADELPKNAKQIMGNNPYIDKDTHAGQQVPNVPAKINSVSTPNNSDISSHPNQLNGGTPVPKELQQAPAFQAATQTYQNAKQKGLTNSKVMTVVDFTQPDTAKRLYVVNTETGKVLMNTYVAQGSGNGAGAVPSQFSNQEGSHASSLGTFVTDTTYNGKNGYSMRVRGLDKGYNDNVYNRDIVVHGSNYIGDGKEGRSWGCFAVPEADARQLISLTQGKSIIYAYGGSKQPNQAAQQPQGNSLNPISSANASEFPSGATAAQQLSPQITPMQSQMQQPTMRPNPVQGQGAMQDEVNNKGQAQVESFLRTMPGYSQSPAGQIYKNMPNVPSWQLPADSIPVNKNQFQPNSAISKGVWQPDQASAMQNQQQTVHPETQQLVNSIAQQETQGSPRAYSIKTPTGRGDYALGKYQILASNIRPWSKEVLGKAITPQQFLASPQLQDQIATAKIDKMMQQYGDAKDVASVWFSGRPLKGNNSRDKSGLNTHDYASQVAARMEIGGKNF